MDLQTIFGADVVGLMGHDFIALINITMIDLVLAGDNAIVVGLAASRVDPAIRARVIFWGMMGAVVLRILFALVATKLLAIVGLTLAGGILLLWVCWKMYREVIQPNHSPQVAGGQDGELDGEQGVVSSETAASMGFGGALLHIILADVSMSLDNVLAVAGAAKGNTTVLVIGLAIAILAMAVAANYIAKLLQRFPWITWVGLLVILYVATDMIWRGSHEVACGTYGGFWCNSTLIDLIRMKAGMM